MGVESTYFATLDRRPNRSTASFAIFFSPLPPGTPEASVRFPSLNPKPQTSLKNPQMNPKDRRSETRRKQLKPQTLRPESSKR